ncbi:hypothetical protein [Stenotrophomonas beteli]|uniref:Uncharacterized protein n=1 Tax=Stenotrophomonas beteli TaxID=3384461 RepID=A0A0R0B8N0_9GAMM|nr:hypothetical protein [Stenotrophomonas maltophilia]KRG49304.1 hypothetical protein ARC23_14560 [Stenotrophomonas maltophilia]
MALQPYSDRARSAQRNWDNQEDPRFDQEHRAEQAADLVKAYRTDPAKLRAAEEQTAGTFSGTHYTEVSLALYRLHHTDPADLMDSGVLEDLYRLARDEAAAIDAQLLEMAQQQVAA